MYHNQDKFLQDIHLLLKEYQDIFLLLKVYQGIHKDNESFN